MSVNLRFWILCFNHAQCSVDDAGGVVALLCIVRLECVGHLVVWLFVTSKEGEKVVGIHGRGGGRQLGDRIQRFSESGKEKK